MAEEDKTKNKKIEEKDKQNSATDNKRAEGAKVFVLVESCCKENGLFVS